FLFVTNASQGGRLGPLIEKTHHHLLAEEGGQDRHTNVDLALFDPDLNTTVLRQALFRDIHIRHHLNTCRRRRFQLRGQTHDLVKAAVDTKTYSAIGIERLNVDVTRLTTDSFDE